MSKTIKVMYHGERAAWDGKIYQLFRDKRGKDHHFTGIKHVHFGNIYPMTDNRMSRSPERTDVPSWESTEKEEIEYEAQKIVVKQHRQSRKREMSLRKPNERIVRAVLLLRPFYLSMSDLDRQRFMKWVSNECSRKGKK